MFGCIAWTSLHPSMQKKILTALSKYSAGEQVKKPVWIWQHSASFPKPPRPVNSENICEIVLKNDLIEMQSWKSAESPFVPQADRKVTTMRLFFCSELEEFDEEDDEDVITNMPSSYKRVGFEACETMTQFDAFETATALTQLKFTGVPWTEEETRKHLDAIMSFHSTIASTLNFDAQEEKNMDCDSQVEGLNLIVDDVLLGSQHTESTWKEIHEDLEGSGVSKLPFRYGGIRKREIRINEHQKILISDAQEALEKLSERFFKETGLVYKPMKNPRAPSAKRYLSATKEASEKHDLKTPEFKEGVFKDVAVSFVLAAAYYVSSVRPDLAEAVNFLQTLFARWDVVADAFLLRFFRYVRSTCGFALLSIIDSRDRKNIQSLGFPDASWASTDQMKSRLGEAIYAVGRRSLALLKWGTTTMKSIATASQECEGAALQKITKDLLVIGDMFQYMLDLNVCQKNAREDNQGLVKCLKKGGISTALAHSRRAHAIKLAFLSDIWEQEDCDLQYLSGVRHPGDPYTKPLDSIPIDQMMLCSLEAEELLNDDPSLVALETEILDSAPKLDTKILKKEAKKVDWKQKIKDRDLKLDQLRSVIQKATKVQDAQWSSKVIGDLKKSTEPPSEYRIVAGQRRKGHHHSGQAEVSQTWRTDSHGPVFPKSWKREKFFSTLMFPIQTPCQLHIFCIT